MAIYKKSGFKPYGKLLTDILGSNLYTKLESVIGEYVANAWDAGASTVHISYPDKDIQDDPNEKIIIKDNGKAFNWDRLFSIAIITQNAPVDGREVIGEKGIGRFAGFKLANKICYVQIENGKKHELEYDLTKIKLSQLEDIELEVKEAPYTESISLKKVELHSLHQTSPLPTKQALTNYLLEEFGLIEDFKIFINGDEVSEEDLSKGSEIKHIKHTSPIFGEVNGRIVARKNSSGMKRSSGIIVRIKNRRVDGPDFFGQEDIPAKVKRRIYGEVNANGLKDLIHSGRETLLRGDPRYVAFTGWLGEEIKSVGDQIVKAGKSDIYEKILGIPKVHSRLEKLNDFQKREVSKILKYISPKLGRVKNEKSLLETIGLLVIRAIENNDFASVLRKLESTPSSDISSLAKLLNEWGIKEIIKNAQIIKSRLSMLSKFSIMIGDPKSRELQDIHSILDKNPWIFDEKFGVFASNQQIRTIAKKLKGEKSPSTKRPDLILRTNNKDFLLVELKKPGVTIGMAEVTQVLKYKSELAKLHPNMRDIDSYLVGDSYDEVALSGFQAGNTQKIHLISLSEILNQAQERLRWIYESLIDEHQTDIGNSEEDFINQESIEALIDIGQDNATLEEINDL